jgi:hypothetical protein
MASVVDARREKLMLANCVFPATLTFTNADGTAGVWTGTIAVTGSAVTLKESQQSRMTALATKKGLPVDGLIALAVEQFLERQKDLSSTK